MDDVAAFNRLINATLTTGREEKLAMLDKNGVLVLPSYYNDSSTGYTKEYGYAFINGNLNCQFLGVLGIVATAHTHPSGSMPSLWTFEGGGDLIFAASRTPHKAVYVFRIGRENAQKGTSRCCCFYNISTTCR